MSYRAVARKLGVSDGTVRRRVEVMASSGIITGSTIFLNPSILGLTCGTFGTPVSTNVTKRNVIEQLRLIDGTVIIQNHHGDFVGVVFLYDDDRELQRKLNLFRSLTQSEIGFFSEMPFPECDYALGPLDWRIISLLVKGDFQSYNGLATALKISSRTVNRRLSNLIERRAIFTLPIVNYGAIKGNVPADLIVFYSNPEKRREIEKQVIQAADQYLFYAGFLRDYGLYNLILPNALTATELYEEVTKLDGVGMAIVELVDERLYQTDILRDLVSKRISLIGELRGLNIPV